VLPVLHIEDEPRFAIRSFMADMGRAPYSVPLLQRLIRIMAQLKLNTLHLHLLDLSYKYLGRVLLHTRIVYNYNKDHLQNLQNLHSESDGSAPIRSE